MEQRKLFYRAFYTTYRAMVEVKSTTALPWHKKIITVSQSQKPAESAGLLASRRSLKLKENKKKEHTKRKSVCS